MTTVTTTGSVDTLVNMDPSVFAAAGGTLFSEASGVLSGIDYLATAPLFVPDLAATHTSASVTGYDSTVSGEVALTGTNLLFSHASTVTLNGTYTSVTYTSGADGGGGTNIPDGVSSMHLVGLIKWHYNANDPSGVIDSTALTSMDFQDGTNSVHIAGKGFDPFNNTGIVTQEVVTTGGVTFTATSNIGINETTSAGVFNTISLEDASHDKVTLTGAFTQSQLSILLGGHSLNTAFTTDGFLNGNDTLNVPTNSQAWHGGNGNDHLTGGANDDTLFGDAGNDTLTGLGGNDTLDGGTGNDLMIGGTGNDTYFVDSTLDKITEGTDPGHDVVNSAVSWTLGANVEDLILGAGTLNGTGNALVNTLTGGTGDNTLDGGANTGGTGDVLIGGTGNDTYIIHSTLDTVTEIAAQGNDTVAIAYNNTGALADISVATYANIENITIKGTGLFQVHGDANDNILIGNASNNSMFGGGGNDTFDGGAGADYMQGGAGNDTFTVDNTNDSIVSGGGSDTVIDKLAAGTFTLATGIDTLIMQGSGALHAIGNGNGDSITGNSGANVIESGVSVSANIAHLAGGAGNDTYIVDNTTDLVIEDTVANAGTDLVIGHASYDLSATPEMKFIENITLAAGAGNINATGNDLKNIITGNEGDNVLHGGLGNDILTGGLGNDTLDGGGGADILNGGLGNDTYVLDIVATNGLAHFIDNGTDTGGNDTWDLFAPTDLGLTKPFQVILSKIIENGDLSGTGSNHINLTGNTSVNILTGNDWDNTLDGGAGADTMDGGNGNDTFFVDNHLDVVNDTGVTASNSDTVVIGYAAAGLTTVSVTDFGGIENLKITGTGLFDLNGDANNNVLTGNGSVNHMAGGAGNDTYFVGAGDVVTENPGEGTDTVVSSVSWTLGSDLENLTLTGSAVTGTGNSASNILTGDAAANILIGNGGNDTFIGLAGADTMTGGTGGDHFDGGAGADRMTGGSGIDTYVFHHTDTVSAANADTITDFDTTIAIGDVLDFSDVLTGYTSGSLADFVHLTQSGANTIVSVDVNGLTGGAHFVNVVTLLGVTAASLTDADTMVANGHLIA